MQVTVPVTVESVESTKVKVPFEMGLAMEGSDELKVPVNETVETSPFAAGYMATKISDPIETPTPRKRESTHP